MLKKLIDDLKDSEVLVIQDWKMKMLLLEFRESMQAFFGKKGIPWHGAMSIRNKLKSEYKCEEKANKLINFESDKVIYFVDSIVEGAIKCHLRLLVNS